MFCPCSQKTPLVLQVVVALTLGRPRPWGWLADAAVTGYNQTAMFEYNPTYSSEFTSFRCGESQCLDVPECQLGDPEFLTACASKLDPETPLTKRVRWDLGRGELWEGMVNGFSTASFSTWCTAINLGFLPDIFDPDLIASDIVMEGLQSNCTPKEVEANPHRAIFLSRNYWYDHAWPGACTSATEIHPIWWDPTALNLDNGTFFFRKQWIRWDMALQVFYSIAELGTFPCQLGILNTSSVYFYTEHTVLAETVSSTTTSTTTRPRGKDVRYFTGPGWENRGNGDVFLGDASSRLIDRSIWTGIFVIVGMLSSTWIAPAW